MIKANVIFSMSWNVLSVLLSMTGVIGPVFGAVMHELSALPVVGEFGAADQLAAAEGRVTGMRLWYW